MTPQEIINLAVSAANIAGDEWLAQAKPKYEVFASDLLGNRLDNKSEYLLDLCGNAFIEFTDKRKRAFKDFQNAGLISYGSTINIAHKFRPRQEHGLKIACIAAAMKVLKENNISSIRMRDYID